MRNNYVNFFSGSPLNRLSWLRTSQSFLNAVIPSPATRWVIFQKGQPLMVSKPRTYKPALARFSTADVRPLLGHEPFFGQGQADGSSVSSDAPALQGARFHGPPVVFLGLHESQPGMHALPSSDFSAKSEAERIVSNLEGTPFFSLDVSDVEQHKLASVLQKSAASEGSAELSFAEPRGAMTAFDNFDASVFATARSLVDWNARNKFCPSCGSPSYSHWAGWKLSCSSLLPWATSAGRQPCLTAKGLHNFSHPRTDPVVIMAVIDEVNNKVLLGRNKNWPEKFYSAMAGFVEPAESFEDAVKRELWEEAGVRVRDVRYHSSQPWPYPSNLMVGFYATADSSQPIRTDLDNELEDARWYTRQEILHVIDHKEGMHFTERDHRKMAEAHDELNRLPRQSADVRGPAAADEPPEVPFRVPPLTAIAGVLIRDWALR